MDTIHHIPGQCMFEVFVALLFFYKELQGGIYTRATILGLIVPSENVV